MKLTNRAKQIARLIDLFNRPQAEDCPVSAGVRAWVDGSTHPEMSKSIRTANMSVRTMNILDVLGIKTHQDLVKLSDEQILATRNAGYTTVTEVAAYCKTHQIPRSE